MGIFAAAVALFGNGELVRTPVRSGTTPPEATPKPKPTVLVIDDDPVFLDTMRMLLRAEGYNVLASSNGPKGLDMVRYGAREIAVVLLDFNMPRFNGVDTLQFLRKLSPDAKVLAVSGVATDELPPEFREGVERVIRKPFSNAELLKVIEEVLPPQPAASPSTPVAA
jgi:CheY-like chemotaxis protein